VEVDRDLRGGGRPALANKTLHCATCGAELDGDPDEDPTGDAGRPICGECERNRDFLALDIARASAGGGHFYYIANAASIEDHITSEVGEALDVVARDVVLEVAAPEGVEVESLSPFPTRVRRGQTEISLGDLTSDERVSVVLRLTFPYGEIGRSTGAVFSVADRDDVLSDGRAKLNWEFADDRTNDDQARDRDVDRAVAKVFAARARQDAVAKNRQGDYVGARHAVEATARRIRGYAGRDSELRAIVSAMEAETQRYAAPMPEMSRKMAFASSHYSMRSRDETGKAAKEAIDKSRT
jgi:hypothetical protein